MATKSTSTTTRRHGAATATNNQGLRKPVFVKIDTLKPGTNGHTLPVKVMNSSAVLNKKPRNPTFLGFQNQNTKFAECLVGDDTGTILFTARNDQGQDLFPEQHAHTQIQADSLMRHFDFLAVELMKPGNYVILRNAKIDMFKGSMRLAVDKWGRIEVTDPAKFVVKEDNNLSLVEYELVNVVEES